jgi:hypothetical protein
MREMPLAQMAQRKNLQHSERGGKAFNTEEREKMRE